MSDEELDLERFSEEEIKKVKLLQKAFTIIVFLGIIAIAILIVLNVLFREREFYCQSSGLYKTVRGSDVISYSKDSEIIFKAESKIVELSEGFSSDLITCFTGDDFSTDIKCSEKVEEVILSYLSSINSGTNKINLSLIYPDAYLESYGDGEHIFFPYEIENGYLKSKEWISISDKDRFNSEYLKDINKISKSEIPESITEEYGNVEILGYLEHKIPLSYRMSSKVFNESDYFFVSVSDLDIEGANGYIDYFGEKSINLMELEPSKELRQLNPNDRFTWILQDDLTEVDGDWCTCYFENKYFEDLSTINVKVKNEKVVDIEISGFES